MGEVGVVQREVLAGAAGGVRVGEADGHRVDVVRMPNVLVQRHVDDLDGRLAADLQHLKRAVVVEVPRVFQRAGRVVHLLDDPPAEAILFVLAGKFGVASAAAAVLALFDFD